MALTPCARTWLVRLIAILTLGLLTSCGSEGAKTEVAATRSVGEAKTTAAPPAAAAPAPAAEAIGEKAVTPPVPDRPDKPPPRTPPPSRAGLLTAAVWDDFTPEHWSDYLTFLGRYEQERWDDRLELRQAARIVLKHDGEPLRNVPVTVAQGSAAYRLTTLGDGSVRLFPGALHDLKPGPVIVKVEGGEAVTVDLGAPLGGIAEATATVDHAPAFESARPRLDLGLMIDATGSMQDEMTYLQTELRDIIGRIAPEGSKLTVRIAVVYYRDRGDAFVTKVMPFTTDLGATIQFLGATNADGGGDKPEDMNAAFEQAMGLDWSGPGKAARLLVVLADAPPHPYPDAQYTYRNALADAGRQGIVMLPIAASGIDKATEHLFRGFAIATGGKYVFLTDDSGIGNPHLKPDITGYEVEPLNRLLVREIRAFAGGYYPELGQVSARD